MAFHTSTRPDWQTKCQLQGWQHWQQVRQDRGCAQHELPALRQEVTRLRAQVELLAEEQGQLWWDVWSVRDWNQN